MNKKEEILAWIRAIKQQRAAAQADRDAMAARITNVRALMKDLGEAPTGAKLATFLKDLKNTI